MAGAIPLITHLVVEAFFFRYTCFSTLILLAICLSSDLAGHAS